MTPLKIPLNFFTTHSKPQNIMENRKLLLRVFAGSAVFVYLIGSFLIASFNIALWQDSHRFFAVVIYLLIVWGAIKALAGPTQQSDSEQISRAELQEKAEI